MKIPANFLITTLRLALSALLGPVSWAQAVPSPLSSVENSGVPPSSGSNISEPGHPLVWDTMEKKQVTKPGETTAEMFFHVTNRGATEVVIAGVKPSCGCTLVDTPTIPWRLAAGAHGTLRTKIDVTGKRGEVAKSILIESPAGNQVLYVRATVPDDGLTDRERNQQLARVDRQAVFRGECAQCHAAPVKGKMGAELFQAACGICHVSPQRASFVPDLSKSSAPRDATYWEYMIALGKPGTLMPAFADTQRGPLTDLQIRSLMDYCVKELSAAEKK